MTIHLILATRNQLLLRKNPWKQLVVVSELCPGLVDKFHVSSVVSTVLTHFGGVFGEGSELAAKSLEE